MEEMLVVEQGVVKAQRWAWLDDMRSWLPVNIPLSHRGPFPHCPDVKSAKGELLRTVSTLCAAFGDDATKLVVGGMRRNRKWKMSFKLSEDPHAERLLPDDWFINENWALIAYALWPAAGSACYGGADYSAKQQRAIERGTYDDEYEDPVKKYVANYYSKERRAPQCDDTRYSTTQRGIGDTSDDGYAPRGAAHSSNDIADDGCAKQRDGGNTTHQHGVTEQVATAADEYSKKSGKPKQQAADAVEDGIVGLVGGRQSRLDLMMAVLALDGGQMVLGDA
ncbi:unnamed protein product [Prorocentrum cordatum]|uniref:Uncharacterized protein n=1 Tax=Prorocentrum cordatum TaxID=2364126 RepID=A0ABN9QAT6_9DINO|nr:unnamed protein product [Polarella glacialis]